MTTSAVRLPPPLDVQREDETPVRIDSGDCRHDTSAIPLLLAGSRSASDGEGANYSRYNHRLPSEADMAAIRHSQRSDAISPQAADVVERVIRDVEKPALSISQDDNNQYSQPTSPAKEGRDQQTPDKNPGVFDLPLESEGEEDSEKRFVYEDDLCERQHHEGDVVKDQTGPQPNHFSASFADEEARLRFSLENARAEFKERFSQLNSSLEEEDLRRRFSVPDASPTGYKGSYSPDSGSLATSPQHQFLSQNSNVSSDELDSNFSPNIKGGLYFCHLCSFSGTSREDFEEHMTCHFEHICPHCDYKSRTEGRLKRHIKDFHTEDPDGGFGARTMPGRPKVFRCKQCDFSATNKVEFWSHSRSHIKDDKLLQCPRCPFVTEYKHHLEYHLRNHFGSKPFKCPKCNYACVNKSMLNSHMKSHTNVYQYRCADCTYATKYCHSLKLHLRKYNHKPAAVLNSDGSLPQGVDATASGLSLLAKRGPPRGPRGPRKDRMDPLVGRFLSMPPSPMARMPGVPGMMSPYWSLLQNQMPNGFPPPPIGMDPRFGSHLPPMPGLREPGQGGPGNPPGMTSGEDGPASSLKCNLCSFTATSREVLTSHMVKVHASENQDLFSIFGISSEALLEENHKRFDGLKSPMKMFDQFQGHMMPRNGNLNIKTERPDEPSTASPHSWPDMVGQGKPARVSKNRSYPDMSFPVNGANAAREQNRSRDEGVDILKQMTLKFGSGPLPTGKRPRVESPLDLTKPRAFSPSPPGAFPQHHPFTGLNQPPQQDEGEHSSGENSIYSQDITSASPRKRARKGKAFKLDTLCLKLQEKQGAGPYGSDEEDPEDLDGCSYSQQMRELENLARSPGATKDGEEGTPMKDKVEESAEHDDSFHGNKDGDGFNGSKDMEGFHGNKDGEGLNPDDKEKTGSPDYNQIHSSLKILNSEVAEKTVPGEQTNSGVGNGKHPQDKMDVSIPVSQCLPPTGGEDMKLAPSSEQTLPVQSKTHSRRKPLPNAIQRGEDVAWKILNNPFIMDAQKHFKNGHLGFEGPQRLDQKMWLDTPDFTSTPKKRSAIDSNYECPHCQIAFGDCIMYTMHMGYHGYKDPYQCNMCGNLCKDRVEFFLHIARAAHN